MKIQCILERNGGSKIELGGLEYHFEPLEDGAHVAEVEDEAHIDRLLSIAEAFKVYHGKLAPKGKAAKVGPATGVPEPVGKEEPQRLRLFGSDAHPPSFDVGGKTYTQFEIVKIAFEASRMTEDEWNELPEDDRAARIDMALDDLDEATAGTLETKTYADGTEATGTAPLPKQSPYEQAANEAKPAKNSGKRTTKKAA